MKVLKCKICREEVGVPENRLSVICPDCAETQQAKRDLEGAIEKQKMNIEKCNRPSTRTRMIETLEILYILHEPNYPMSKEVRTFADRVAGEISTGD